MPALLLAAAVVAVFWPVVGHEFVNYDDPTYVTKNPQVLEGLTLAGLRWAWISFHAANWHPLTWLSHMLDQELHGTWSGGHHLTSLLLHVLNTVLLFLLLARMTGAVAKSVIVAALFGLHPLHVESVAWVAERKDVLSTFFWLATTSAYVRYVRAPGGSRYSGVVILFAAGLCAKPMLVTLPFTLLLLDYWPLGRLESGFEFRRLVREKIPLFLLCLISSGVTLAAQGAGGAVASLETYPLALRLANAVVSYGAYLLRVAWPAALAVHYPHPRESLPAWSVLASALVLTGVTTAVIRWHRRRPYLLVGWLWYLGTLVPVIGIVQVGKQALADRYTYVPLIGIFVMLAWTVAEAPSARPRQTLRAATGIALIVLMIVAFRQVGHWRDSITLFEHTLHVTRDNPVAHTNLGNGLVDRGRLDEAIAHLERAVELDPRVSEAQQSLGTALLKQGRPASALGPLARALELRPGFYAARRNLAEALLDLGRLDESERELGALLGEEPEDPLVLHKLSLVYLRKGRLDEAAQLMFRAIEGLPGSAELQTDLGMLQFMRGRAEEATAAFREALRSRPGYFLAHYRMGLLQMESGRFADAVVSFEAALADNPSMTLAWQGLAEAYRATDDQGNADRALRRYRELAADR